MGRVPPDYLLWLLRQDWIVSWPDLRAYLVSREGELLELEKEQAPPDGGEGFTSLDDYLRHGRS